MAQAIFDPIPTYADTDLGRRDAVAPARFPRSRQALSLPAQGMQKISFVVNPLSLSEWFDKYPIASGDASLPADVTLLDLGDMNATAGETWLDWRVVPDASEGRTTEKFTLSRNPAAQRFLDTIRQNMNEDTADVVREGGNAPTQATINACLAVASTLSDIVASKPNLKYAAFVEESGGISLVLRSERAGRRANFRVSPDGLQLSVVTVSSHGQTGTNSVRIDDTQQLQGWVEWLDPRD